ncbi:ubx domain-containing protein 3 [Lasius niger]|uniref:Ubx domain-containing protein 3 n=1 Tax=Lasius niger TaxID=67767 RepID=A0A0J7JYD7_LASNI|nr:ubx domain-containing protein 3 [Lasius niger]
MSYHEDCCVIESVEADGEPILRHFESWDDIIENVPEGDDDEIDEEGDYMGDNDNMEIDETDVPTIDINTPSCSGVQTRARKFDCNNFT